MATSAVITWNANTESDIFGYHAYWGLYPGIYPASSGALASSVTSFNLDGAFLASDGLYYVTIDAFDTSLNVSAKATPVTKRIVRTASKLIVRR